MKVQPNSPCPCGSSYKTKRCCGVVTLAEMPRQPPRFNIQMNWPGSSIEYRLDGTASSIVRVEGDLRVGRTEMRMKGMTLAKLPRMEDVALRAQLTNSPNDITTRVRMDLPIRIHIERHEFRFHCQRPGSTFFRWLGSYGVTDSADESRRAIFAEWYGRLRGRVRVIPKRRGQELWPLPLDTLSTFTHLDIDIETAISDEEFSWAIHPIMNYIIDKELSAVSLDLSNLASQEFVNIDVDYFRGPTFEPARGKWIGGWSRPGFGEVTSLPQLRSVTTDERALLDQLEGDLTARALGLLPKANQCASAPSAFVDLVLAVIEDFSLYGRQHAATLSRLQEEQVRDLLIVPFKVIFRGRAEAECYSVRGRSDIKVLDPDNARNHVSIELKWWSGTKSLAKAIRQLTVSHYSGHEKCLIGIVLSKRKDYKKTKRDVDAFMGSMYGVTPGQKRLASQVVEMYEFSGRYGGQPLAVGIMDLYSPSTV